MDKPKIFISHLSAEGDIAEVLKKHLEEDFKGVEVFVSSESIRVGDQSERGTLVPTVHYR